MMAKTERLLAEERRRKILEIVEQNGQITIADLVRQFSVSAVTARGDLNALEKTAGIVRSHGGAIRRPEAADDYPLRLKETLNRAEKARIARAAVDLLRPNETIILDSGTTTAEVARQIKTRRIQPLTVITNALNIAAELSDAAGVTLLMIGGLMRPTSNSFVGPQAEAMLREIHADRLFLGVDGVDPAIGPTTPDVLEAQLNGLMMLAAREVVIVADASKLGRRSVSKIGPIERVKMLITDTRATADMVGRFEAKGVAVTLV